MTPDEREEAIADYEQEVHEDRWAERLDELEALDLSLNLAHDEPKVFCTAERRDRRGYVVLSCSLHKGHQYEHVDVHAGRRWEDR